MANTRQELGRAFELIKRDQLEEAVAIVKPITEVEPENADAWWLLANASSEPRDARRALVNVLKINPAYPKARGLLDKLNELYPPRDDELMMMLEIEDVEPPLPSAPPPVVEEGGEAEDEFLSFVDSGPPSEVDELFQTSAAEGKPAAFDELEAISMEGDPFTELLAEGAKPRRRRAAAGRGRRLLRLALVAVLLVVIFVAAVVLVGGGEEKEAPQAQISDPADLVELTAEQVNAENAALLEDMRASLEQDAKTGLLPDARAVFVQVDAGSALVIKICAAPDPTLPQTAIQAMRMVANRAGNTPALQGFLSEVGVTLEDCTRGNDTLYRATSPMAAVKALVENTADPQAAFATFQQSWVIES